MSHAAFKHVLCLLLLQVLGKFITTCFKVVHYKNMKSIAFPAIGTGQLNIPPDFVAKIMIEELLKFSQTYKRTSLENVRYILYFTNLPAMQASKLSSLQLSLKSKFLLNKC